MAYQRPYKVFGPAGRLKILKDLSIEKTKEKAGPVGIFFPLKGGFLLDENIRGSLKKSLNNAKL